MNTRADVVLQYLRSEFPGFDASNVTDGGSVDYAFCIQRPGEIFWLRVRRAFLDSNSADALAGQIRRIDLASKVRRLGAARVTVAGVVESLAQ